MRTDSLLHLTISYIISSLLLKYTNNYYISFLVSILIGVLKEVYDAKIKGTFFSWKDLSWDILGIVLGLIL